jgi:hypothetical protein
MDKGRGFRTISVDLVAINQLGSAYALRRTAAVIIDRMI